MAIAAAGLLTAIAVKLIDDVQDETVLVGAFRDDFRARWAVKAPVAMAIAALQEEEDNFTGFTQKWANFDEEITVGGIRVRFKVRDESAKVNLNALADKEAAVQNLTAGLLKALYRAREVEVDLVDYLKDWVDSDDEETSPGGEGSYYRSLPDPYEAKNLGLDSLSELSLVRGYSDKTLAALGFEKRADSVDLGLSHYLTVFSDSRVNLNTADPEIIRNLLENISENFVEALLLRREDNPIEKIDEIRTMTGMDDELFNRLSPIMGVSSGYFSVSAEAVAGRIKKRLIAVLRKNGNRVAIVYWRLS